MTNIYVTQCRQFLNIILDNINVPNIINERASDHFILLLFKLN